MSNGEGYRDDTADIAVAHVMKEHKYKTVSEKKYEKKGVQSGTIKTEKSNKN